MCGLVGQVWLTLVLVLLPTFALAQSGTITGKVVDPQGAVLPGVTVVVHSPALAEARATVTNGDGEYQIVSLPSGVYRVTFSLPGFKTEEVKGIEVAGVSTVSVNTPMGFAPLLPSQVISIIEPPPLVDVLNASQRRSVMSDDAPNSSTLPTTRDLLNLAHLVPGLTIPAYHPFTSEPFICGGGVGQAHITGGQSGCDPLLNAFNSHSSMSDFLDTSLNRGRVTVDGMNVMGVGAPSFLDPDGPGGSGLTPYLVDVQNHQEIVVTLSGAMGDSETGGATINIVPRTGDNRYAGSYYTSYGRQAFLDRNAGIAAQPLLNQLDSDFDHIGSLGGPIIRHRVWFQGGARYRGRQTALPNSYHNRNEGVFGANFVPDLDRPVGSSETYRNAQLRLTLQASQKNKFNVFWDEQFTCQNPCEGTVNLSVSPEASPSNLSHPLRVAQARWANPLTNTILLDAAVSWNSTHYDLRRNRVLPAYQDLPRIFESGETARVSSGIASGAINNATFTATDRWETRASFSYVTGSHFATLGYQGSFLAAVQRNHFNDLRLDYEYATPGTTASSCVPSLTPPLVPSIPLSTVTGLPVTTVPTLTWCGLLRAGVANPNDSVDSMRDAFNRPTCVSGAGEPVCRFPQPANLTQWIPTTRDEEVTGTALYAQDQWTVNRLTITGALRYDRATSHFNETCVGGDRFMGSRSFCLNSPDAPQGQNGKGVDFKDITPRWGVAWDVFGSGRTAVKWTMGKYLSGANVGGIFTSANPAGSGKVLNNFRRGWRDLDGDRRVDCDLSLPVVAPSTAASIPANGECAPITPGTIDSTSDYRRFGRSPYELDEAALAIGMNRVECGRNDMTQFHASLNRYCASYFADGGSSILEGWNRRQYEWQFGLGVQHELVPHVALEVTYNRRWSRSLLLADQIGLGCDLYSASADASFEFGEPDVCMDQFLAWNSPRYDFYALQAPEDPALPDGGGFRILGFNDRKPGIATDVGSGLTAVTLDENEQATSVWHGVDVAAIMNARGVHMSGGVSIGAVKQSACRALFNAIEDRSVVEYQNGDRGCEDRRPLQTNMRGIASYTIPGVDLLVSSVFSYRPGVQLIANHTWALSDIQWMPGSEYRATNTVICGVVVGCLLANPASPTVTQNLLSDDTYGEGIGLIDVKVAKNIRIAGVRFNIGVDVYNLFNTDAPLGYCTTFPTCTVGGVTKTWPAPTLYVTPRYGRFQLQVDF